MKILLFFVIAACAYAADVEKKEATADVQQSKDKRQNADEGVPEQYVYRTARKQEPVAPVEEPQDDDKTAASRDGNDLYRPGQVISLNAQELLDLQPERKAPVASSQQLQQLYSDPQTEQKQNLQQFYYLDPQIARQVAYQPSHAVIARPDHSSNGGEASVGAALSVSDTGASPSDSFDHELLALLSHTPIRNEHSQTYPAREESRQTYEPAQQPQPATPQSVAPQYQQIDRYLSKPVKKPTKPRSKVQITPPQSSTAPQQYLIETTNVQQVQPQHVQQQYRPSQQPHRSPQSLRYVSIPQTTSQQIFYDSQEPQGLKVVAPPKLDQQPRPQPSYRYIPQYQQAASPKQFRVIEAPRSPLRQEQSRPSPSVERPVAYLKRFPDPEKMRAIKLYEQTVPEGVPQQSVQIIGEQYYLRPVYRTEQRGRYEVPAPLSYPPIEQTRPEPSKPPHSAIYVNKNVAPKKQVLLRPQQPYQRDQQRFEQPRIEQINIEQHGQNIEDRSHLPPPRNNKAYTPEEFGALVAAGYAVTPIPVSSSVPQTAQSRSSIEVIPQPQRRPLYRRNQYLPLRGDDAP